ncbi:MAG TPA: hypothetical protein VHU84_07485, partial [Lacipirellulaceae bacterium]|nr:hypothetical protein [Lacipirellulaceae bacterium]
MFLRSIIFLGITAAALAGECRPKPVASPPAPPTYTGETPTSPTIAAPIDSSKSPPTADQSPATLTAPTTVVEAAKNTETLKPPTAEALSTPVTADATKSTDPSAEKNHSVRLAVLTPGGPILVDVNLTIDGRPLTEAFDKLIDDVLAAADTDKDKHSTWKELAANEAYFKKQPGGDPVRSRDLKMWTEQYDRNHDGEIQPDEAAAWLGRNSGRRAQAFNLRSSRSYFSVPSASSRIWKMLDANDDEQLSAEELAQCAKTLLAFDDDDDGAVSADEFQSLREQLQVDAGSAARVERTGNPFAALYLEPEFKADRLEYLLTDLYAPQQMLGPE